MSRGPTDTQRLWTELHRAGRQGIHSFDIRAQLGMGNPSQRVSEIEDDHSCTVPRRREKRNGRMGVRYFHPDHAPAGLDDGFSPEVVVEPSRDSNVEQLGLIPTPPAIYDDAA